MQLKPSIPEGVAPPLLSPSPGTPLDIVYAGHKHFSHLVLLPEIPTPTLLLFSFLWKKKILIIPGPVYLSGSSETFPDSSKAKEFLPLL
jgi:hypothetical protein